MTKNLGKANDKTVPPGEMLAAELIAVVRARNLRACHAAVMMSVRVALILKWPERSSTTHAVMVNNDRLTRSNAMTMTADDLRTDRLVIDAATPGPWTIGEDERECAATLRAQPCVNGQSPQPAVDVIIPFGRAFSDARMISKARTRWPAALDEIEQLRRLLNQALVLVHMVGSNGGMRDLDHTIEADIRRAGGI